jgi:hypothetical protein
MFDVTTQFAAAATAAAAVIRYKWNARRTDGKGVNTVRVLYIMFLLLHSSARYIYAMIVRLSLRQTKLSGKLSDTKQQCFLLSTRVCRL